MLGRCSHEFSWPRRASDRDHYQVCLLCAAEYKYDWQTMRRTKRVNRSKAHGVESPIFRRSRSHARAKPTWVPRARRLKLQVPLRYRAKNLDSWHEGVIDNLSQSGLLFHGSQRFPENTLLEMVFEMPEEISGQKNSTVLCQGRVTRAKESTKDKKKSDSAPILAASILDYTFLHQDRP
jgi:hypothetical protein